MPTTSPHVLLVEDDRDIQLAMQDVLAEEGFVVTVANNGQEALDELDRTRPLPTAILLDLTMPVMDGFEFCTRMRGLPHYAAIPVVVASADRQARDRVVQLGVVAFLAKPLQLDELLNTLEGIRVRAASAARRASC